MCGIVGYTGSGRREAGPILLQALARCEYHAFDASGLAVEMGGGRGLVMRKLTRGGQVAALSELVDRLPVHGASGIAQTGAATTGSDCHDRIAVVHAGRIENAAELRDDLRQTGHTFTSDTDTETLAHLIEDARGATLQERVVAALAHVAGTYSLAAISADEPGKIVVARRGVPLIVGGAAAEEEAFVASDRTLVERAEWFVALDDGDVAVLTPAGCQLCGVNDAAA